MTQTSKPAARIYPRDVEAGTRILVKLAGYSGSRKVVGTVASIEQVGNRYRLRMDYGDKLGGGWINMAANGKLDVVR